MGVSEELMLAGHFTSVHNIIMLLTHIAEMLALCRNLLPDFIYG